MRPVNGEAALDVPADVVGRSIHRKPDDECASVRPTVPPALSHQLVERREQYRGVHGLAERGFVTGDQPDSRLPPFGGAIRVETHVGPKDCPTASRQVRIERAAEYHETVGHEPLDFFAGQGWLDWLAWGLTREGYR